MKRLFTLLVFFAVIHVQAQLLRGPYLQSMTNKSVKILWRTANATPAVVRYGTALNNLTNSVADTAQKSNHILQISGLLANTKYYYQIEDGNMQVLAGNDEQHHFITAPVIGDSTIHRFWVTGDFGAGNTDQVLVKQWFQNYLTTTKVDAWLWLGDNTYTNGTDAEYSRNVFSKDYGYDSLFRFLPFYPIPGNHDYNSVNGSNPINPYGPYFDMVEVFKNAEMGGYPSNTEAFYSYDYGNIHFVAMNSELYPWLLFNLPNAYKTWLENDLRNTTQPFKIAYWHQPPYSKGSHDSDDWFEFFMKAMREQYLPILERYGVDLVLNGHSHVYERSYLINKHYGLSPTFNRSTMMVDSTSGNPDSNRLYIKYTYGANKNKGTVYAVVGNSGKSEAENNKMHPVMYKKYAASGGVGSMILEVSGHTLVCKYYKANGELLDKFSIVKMDSTVISAIKENKLINQMQVYPNPFNQSLTVDFSAQKSGEISIYIQNISGQLLTEKLWDGKSKTGANSVFIDHLDELPKGEYIISITQNGEILSKTIEKL